MNRSKRFVIFLLVAALIGVTLASHVMQATANSTGEVKVVVSNSSQLYSALLNAKDGDIIGVDAQIMLSSASKYGYPDRHITLKRMKSSAFFNVGSEVTFENITFDGGGISTSNAYIITNGKMTFRNITFKNSVNSNSGGGAVHIVNNTADFYNCTFEENYAVEGGHIYVNNSSIVNIENSTFKNGHAITYGGAIMNGNNTGTINITSSIITENSAERHGGGITNRGNLHIAGTKIFDNIAPGGSDISNYPYGNLTLADTIETLVELFKDDGIIPKGWINDYDGSTSLSDPDINPTAENSLFKLFYEFAPTEVILVPASLGIAGDGKITGLESEKYYKVIADDVISYSKADGTLTLDETEAEALIGTEIIGLINGMVYLVEEHAPAQEEEPVIDDDEEKPDEQEPEETESPNEPGNDEESNDEEEQENQENPSNPDEDEDTEQPDDNDEQEENEPIEQDDDKTEQDKGSQQEDKTETNNQNTSSTTTTTSSNSTTNANTTDSSSTVNNYSYVDDHSTHTTHNSLPGTLETTSREPNTARIEQAPITQEQTVRIEAGSATNESVIIKETGQGITINVNVTVESEPKQNSVYDEVQAAKLISNFEPVQSAEQQENGIHWLDVIKLCLLFGIFVAVIRK